MDKINGKSRFFRANSPGTALKIPKEKLFFERFSQKRRIPCRNSNKQQNKQQNSMKTLSLRINSIMAIAGFLLAVEGTAYPQQSLVIGTTNEEAGQLVELGDDASFSVIAVAGYSYQWLHNGAPIGGQTNSILTIGNAQISDAGFYSCHVANGVDTASTASASLEVFRFSPDFDVVVYAFPVVSGGSQGTCPGAYAGYVNYLPTNGWGFTPSTGTTVYTASDGTRTNTKVEYVGAYGDNGCNQTTVTIPYPAVSPAYRFTIYFTNNVPSTNYPITLTGFNP